MQDSYVRKYKPSFRGVSCPAFFALGLVSTACGLIGAVVPGLPTTVFLIIALWAFSKSSARMRDWLWHHKRFGPALQAWHTHRVIPAKAKWAAVSTMCCSATVLTVSSSLPPAGLAAVGVCMSSVAVWIVTRKSRICIESASR